MTGATRWVVTLSGERPAAQVAAALRDTGFRVGEVMEAIGVVTGEGGPEIAERVRALEGVADVSPDSPVELAPPDSPVQ